MNYTASDILFSDTPLVDAYQPQVEKTAPAAVTTDDDQLLEFRRKLGLIDTVTQPPVADTIEITPSRATMEERYFRDYTADVVPVTKTSLSTKQKIAIASFIAVTLVLILGVTLCSLAVAGAFADLAATEAAYTDSVAQLEVLSEQLNADNIDQLYQRAEQNGYVQMSSANSIGYKVLSTRPAQNFDIQTNWFDTLCDWVGGLFGGN